MRLDDCGFLQAKTLKCSLTTLGLILPVLVFMLMNAAVNIACKLVSMMTSADNALIYNLQKHETELADTCGTSHLKCSPASSFSAFPRLYPTTSPPPSSKPPSSTFTSASPGATALSALSPTVFSLLLSSTHLPPASPSSGCAGPWTSSGIPLLRGRAATFTRRTWRRRASIRARMLCYLLCRFGCWSPWGWAGSKRLLFRLFWWRGDCECYSITSKLSSKRRCDCDWHDFSVSAVSFVRLAAIRWGKTIAMWRGRTASTWSGGNASSPFLFPFPLPLFSHWLDARSLIEMTVGIVCACLPCFRALAKHHFPNAFRWLDRRVDVSRYGVIEAISMHVRSWRWTRTRVASSAAPDTRKSGGYRPLGSAATDVDGTTLRGDISVDVSRFSERTGEVWRGDNGADYAVCRKKSSRFEETVKRRYCLRVQKHR